MFLESAENLKRLIEDATGREPSTGVTKDAIACLQQGRLFYEAAAAAPLEIRPLLLFYGMTAYAKALVVARCGKRLSTFPQKHGLKDISDAQAKLIQTKVRVLEQGTFQVFNDVVRDLARVCYMGDRSRPTSVYIPTVESSNLASKELPLKEILSRVPGIQELYFSTFQEPANTQQVELHYFEEYARACELLIFDKEVLTDRNSLRRIVGEWRRRFRFLEDWTLCSAENSLGVCRAEFVNTLRNADLDDTSEEHLRGKDGRFSTLVDPRANPADFPRFRFTDRLDPLAGGYAEIPPHAVVPVQGLHVSEFSLQYLGMFILASLVRYRPELWVHSLFHVSTDERPADDQAIALVEAFLERNSSIMPQFVSTALNPRDDRWR